MVSEISKSCLLGVCALHCRAVTEGQRVACSREGKVGGVGGGASVPAATESKWNYSHPTPTVRRPRSKDYAAAVFLKKSFPRCVVELFVAVSL